MAKKYFWLKLKDNFFEDVRMKKLRRNAGGATYTLIYLKMQLLSLKKEGILIYQEVEDSFYEEIAYQINEDPVDVEFTIMFLIKHGLLESVEDNHFALPETMNSIGSETQAAERVRKHRELKKNTEALQCNAYVTTSNTEKEKEKEKEIKKDKKDIHQQVDEVVKVQQWEIDFNEFWKLYPRKIEKKKASSAYKTKHKLHGRETILNGLKNYLQEIQIKNTGTQYIKHPTSYLNGESYFNEPDLKPINQSQQNNLFNPWEEEQYDYRTNQNIIHDNRQQLPNTPKQIGF